MALPSTHLNHLFVLLSQNVGINQWRAAYTPSGHVASFKRVQATNGLIIEWRILSFGWKIENASFIQNDSFTSNDFDLLTKLSPKALTTIAASMGIIDDSDKMNVISTITSLSPEKRVVLLSDDSSNRATKCLKCIPETLCNECEKRHEQIRNKTYQWKQEELERMKGRELDQICETLNLKKSGLRKKQKIEKILLACDPEAGDMIERKVFALVGTPRTDVAPLHQFYRQQFNTVDKANQVQHSATMPARWKSEMGRMIHGVMKLSLTNLFCKIFF